MHELDEPLRELIPRLRRFAVSLTRNVSSADDLVQSTLERAISRWVDKRVEKRRNEIIEGFPDALDLMLVCVEGMRYREAALALDVPLGTVMSRLGRARAALAQALQDDPALLSARLG